MRFTSGSKIPELSVLAESQTIEPVSARALLLTDNKDLVISPYLSRLSPSSPCQLHLSHNSACFSSFVSQVVLVSYI